MSKTRTGAPILESGAESEMAERLIRAEREAESLCEEILERYEEANLVHRLSQRLATVLGETSVARLVVDEARLALELRTAELWLAEEESVVLAASTATETLATEENRELHEHGPLTALQQGRPWTRDASFGNESIAAVPLPGPTKVTLGVLVLRGLPDQRSFRTGQLKILTALACLTSAFIRNDRLAKQALKAEAMDRDDELNRDIQGNLQFGDVDPGNDPAIDWVARCTPSARIGADLCGVVPMEDGSSLIVMAKPSRPGTGSAIRMAAFKGALMSLSQRAHSPDRILTEANAALIGELAQCEVSIDAFVARVEAGAGRMHVSAAGDVWSCLLRSTGDPECLTEKRPALGSSSEPIVDRRTHALDAGSVLVVANRGIFEARDAIGNPFGTDRLASLAAENREHTASEIHRRILGDLYRHCPEPRDDVSLIVLRVSTKDESNIVESAS